MSTAANATATSPSARVGEPARSSSRASARATARRQFGKEVVSGCSFTIERGKLTVMIGPSGCGKSTLIRLLAGFEKPTSGTIRLNGKPVTGPGRDRLVLFQETRALPLDDDLRQHPVRAARPRRGHAEDARARRVPARQGRAAATFRKKYPTQLSGGMQRRAELARAMINNPEVMILDEPFRGLDAMTKELMWEYYSRLYEESGRTNFFVTTDIDEAIFLADRLLIMSNIPTQVRAVVEVDMPRPRRPRPTWSRDDRANEIKMEALSLLHEEAMKSFAARQQGRGRFRRGIFEAVAGEERMTLPVPNQIRAPAALPGSHRRFRRPGRRRLAAGDGSPASPQPGCPLDRTHEPGRVRAHGHQHRTLHRQRPLLSTRGLAQR